MTSHRGTPKRQPPRKPPQRRSRAEAPQEKPRSSGKPTSRAAQSASDRRHSAASVKTAPPPAVQDPLNAVSTPSASDRSSRWQRWLTNWKVLITLAALLCGTSGVVSIAYLFRLPGIPNCPSVFWPLASASIRIHCGQIAADKYTANDLLEAIALVDGISADHPLRGQADELIEQWSEEVLKLVEQLFHEGKLDEAIAAARKIPGKVTAHKLVEERIKQWQTIWGKAEGLYRKAEDQLRKRNVRQAFVLAVRLLDLDNKYWQTTKYDELTRHINTVREDNKKLGKAERLADWGGLEDLVQAIKLVEEIKSNSYVYQAAQKLIPQFGRKILNLAQGRLDRGDFKGAMAAIDKIPKKAKLDADIRDFTILANARAQAWEGTVLSLEDAITQAKRIQRGRPLYAKTQQLITYWQSEISAVAMLDKARMLAQPGTVDDLNAAIAEAAQITQSNPRWKEAQREINGWQTEIETLEDGPILAQAESLALPGDQASLEVAIAQASQISSRRALSKEAQRKIGQWRSQIQQLEDQPLLDQAREYARLGDWRAAVETAKQIQPGRSLYQDAQADIQQWRGQIQTEVAQVQAEQNLQQAQQVANAGTTNALATAIQLADQVPLSSPRRSEADAAINDWSWRLLEAARQQAWYNPAAAIAIAQKIPARAQIYTEAQTEIATWQNVLNRR